MAIIKNEFPLRPDFDVSNYPSLVYERPKCTEELMNEIFLPVMEKRLKWFSFFVEGPPGSGKTTLIKFVSEKARDLARKRAAFWFDVVYYKCESLTTLRSILEKVLKSPVFVAKNKKGNASIDLETVKKVLEINNAFIVLIVDELEKIENPIDLYSIVHTFARASENKLIGMDENFNIKYALVPVLITNNSFRIKQKMRKTGQVDVDQDLLCMKKILIPFYKAEELYEIIKRRAAISLYESAYDAEDNGNVPIFRIMANRLMSSFGVIGPTGRGLGREAVLILYHSALHAEKRGAEKIEKEDVDRGLEEIFILDLKKTLSVFGEHALFALEALCRYIQMKSIKPKRTLDDFDRNVVIQFSQWYSLYKNVAASYGYTPISDRQFRRYVDKLIDYRIIGSERRKYWLIESVSRIMEVINRLGSSLVKI